MRVRAAILVPLILAGLVVSVVVLVRVLLSPERFSGLLAREAAAVGLELRLPESASPTLWPKLAVRLRGPEIRRDGHAAVLASARELLLVVPWRSLLGGEARIETLEAQGLYLDLGEAQPWLEDFASDDATEAEPRLPSVDAGVRIGAGTVVRGNELLLKGLELETGRLAAGEPFSLSAAGLDAAERSLSLQLHAVPAEDASGIRLEPLRIHLAAGAPASLDLEGRLAWRGGTDLDGELAGPLALANESFRVQLAWEAVVPDAGRHLHVTVDGEGTHLDLRLDPASVMAWWEEISAGGESLPLPPASGEVDVERLELGSLRIEGLRLESLPAPEVDEEP